MFRPHGASRDAIGPPLRSPFTDAFFWVSLALARVLCVVHSTTKQLGYLDFARITASASDELMSIRTREPARTREPVAPTPEEVGRHISVWVVAAAALEAAVLVADQVMHFVLTLYHGGA